MNTFKVAVIMGSDSDWNVMSPAADVLRDAGVNVVSEVVSAHRTPEKMVSFAKGAKGEGFHLIIAGAGGAAHLPGMVASLTPLPVIGVPVPLEKLDGMDSLLSIVQMPAGIPVATVGIGQSKNAALLALRILAIQSHALARSVDQMMSAQTDESMSKVLPDQS